MGTNIKEILKNFAFLYDKAKLNHILAKSTIKFQSIQEIPKLSLICIEITISKTKEYVLIWHNGTYFETSWYLLGKFTPLEKENLTIAQMPFVVMYKFENEQEFISNYNTFKNSIINQN